MSVKKIMSGLGVRGTAKPSLVSQEVWNKISSKFTFRLLIGLWSLIAVLITAGYRNEFTVDLLAPLPISGNITTFLQTKSFRFQTISRNGEAPAFVKILKQRERETNISSVRGYELASWHCGKHPDVIPEAGSI